MINIKIRFKQKDEKFKNKTCWKNRAIEKKYFWNDISKFNEIQNAFSKGYAWKTAIGKWLGNQY